MKKDDGRSTTLLKSPSCAPGVTKRPTCCSRLQPLHGHTSSPARQSQGFESLLCNARIAFASGLAMARFSNPGKKGLWRRCGLRQQLCFLICSAAVIGVCCAPAAREKQVLLLPGRPKCCAMRPASALQASGSYAPAPPPDQCRTPPQSPKPFCISAPCLPLQRKARNTKEPEKSQSLQRPAKAPTLPHARCLVEASTGAKGKDSGHRPAAVQAADRRPKMPAATIPFLLSVLPFTVPPPFHARLYL